MTEADEKLFEVSVMMDLWQIKAWARAHCVLTVLRVRGIAVPDEAREWIQTAWDLEKLNRWLEKAVFASSVDDVIGRLD